VSLGPRGLERECWLVVGGGTHTRWMGLNRDVSDATTAQEWVATHPAGAATREARVRDGRWMPVTPEWVKPPPWEVEDLHWLAYQRYANDDSSRAAGICVTLAWVRGGRAAPVTGRDERPVTALLAAAEMWAAVAVSEDGPPPPLRAICADLDVAYWEPTVTDRGYARGVQGVLEWLLGTPGVNGRVPPMLVPKRHPDGSVPTVKELYQQEIATGPYRQWGPEARQALRDRFQVEVCRYHRLVEEIEDTKRRLSGR
jgi:hypothetical protein